MKKYYLLIYDFNDGIGFTWQIFNQGDKICDFELVLLLTSHAVKGSALKGKNLLPKSRSLFWEGKQDIFFRVFYPVSVSIHDKATPDSRTVGVKLGTEPNYNNIVIIYWRSSLRLWFHMWHFFVIMCS